MTKVTKYCTVIAALLASVFSVALMSGGAANAAPAPPVHWQDTRITYYNLVSPAAPSGGTAAAGIPGATGATVAVTAADDGLASFAVVAATLPSTLTYTADATSTAGGVLSLTSVGAPLTAPVTVNFDETAADGDTSVLSVTVVAAAPGIQLATVGGHSVDVPTLALTDDNVTGNIDLAPAAATDPAIASFTVGNAPDNFVGTQIGDVLDTSLGIVAPGEHFDGVTLVTADAEGAVLHSTFDLRIVAASKVKPTGTYGPGYTRSYVSDTADLCLDNSNFTWADGNPVQLWQCRAFGSRDQRLEYVITRTGSELAFVDPHNGSRWCVTQGVGTAQDDRQLVIESCGNGTGNQQVTRSGELYRFGGRNGPVFDDKGASTEDGALVIAFGANGGSNQNWSLP